MIFYNLFQTNVTTVVFSGEVEKENWLKIDQFLILQKLLVLLRFNSKEQGEIHRISSLRKIVPMKCSIPFYIAREDFSDSQVDDAMPESPRKG